jgi:hypothetical protein
MRPSLDNALAVADFFVGGSLALVGFSVVVAMNDALAKDRWGSYALSVSLIVVGLFVVFCDLLARRTKRDYIRRVGRISGYSLMAILFVAALFIPTLH